MLRSDDMTKCDVYFQSEAAFENLSAIGEMECLQFIDMNPNVSPVDRHFVTELCRCADLERTLINIRDEIHKDGIAIPRVRYLADIKPLAPRDMFEFENMIDSVSKDVKDMTANQTNLKKLRSETKEIYYVLNHLDPILGDVESRYTKFPKQMQPPTPYDRRQLKIITGVVDRANTFYFQTMLWRISHGTIYYKEAPNDDKFQNPTTGRDVRKVAFVIVCHGEEMQERVLKVCNGFNVNLYRWPETHEGRVSTIRELADRMNEMDKWETWMAQIRKAKAIYHTMNMMNLDITSNTLIGQCWMADRNFNDVEDALEKSSQLAGARSFIVRMYTDETPPTSYKTTRFTKGFQSIINSYDCGRYKELNPGPFFYTVVIDERYWARTFSVILFPFLFGVMFGDVGHGVLLFIYASWMINNEKKYLPRRTKNDVWHLIFAGRYIILLMGCFSIFMGFMYNEWFSLHSKMMSGYWLNTHPVDRLQYYLQFHMNPKADTGYIYKYGIDPGVKMALNGLEIENSLKMKLAIILGVTHLTLGLILSIFNMVYFKKYYAIICHTVPRILFIWCIYGWLCYMMFYKWICSFTKKAIDNRSTMPNLRQEFLDIMFWRELSLKEKPQNFEQKRMLYHIALICFPVMLLASPLYIYIKYRLQLRYLQQSGLHGPCQLGEYKKHESADVKLKSLLAHRCLRTMEYGLAAVSHMASYLRLWAISMAHTLLSRFVWAITMRNLALSDYTSKGYLKIIYVFPIWALITLGFLVFMDSVTVFIHALRLHWIEFMSKFFKGGGQPFTPFSLVTVLDELDYNHVDEETEMICRVKRARANAGDS
ncbi:V-type proton ATPase 116 kDa subunit a1-like [Amyelois transitella]|uniref:V-type proton ATPase 116 kDa subunit a1-like n=1 Tax=Amyelois transitella TaxID=680683 RepID=UPI00298FD101|nr:V-type proton ATPase 116 kDa subunit a1-like [Amyelois transitella]